MLLPMVRSVFLSLLCLAWVACSTKPPPKIEATEIQKIQPEYKPESSFKRINEFLTGVEAHGKRTVVRTQANSREGFYFTLRLDQKVKDLPSGTLLIAELYTPKQSEAQRFELTLPSKRGNSSQLLFGLTGTDWPYQREHTPAAWKFTLLDPNGKILGSAQSYLWK
ncbi:MAG: Uncharacterised protein [Opitutia bacterium UBA7350]|nr:MAG: Uncharacterised protein [Opitutae bacterium UBA7350]